MIVIEKWAGLVTNASPYALPPGAAVTQVNLQVLNPGQVTVRPGLVNVAWATHTAGTTAVVNIINFQNSTFPQIVYQNAAGELRVAKNPT